MNLREKLEKKRFVFTVEMHLPKGTNLSHVKKKALLLKGKVDAFNVPDSPRSVLKVGSLGVCSCLKGLGLEPIFQLACKDRNRLALQMDLLSASVMGIKNVLVMTGDSPMLGDHPGAKKVYDLSSVELLKTVSCLNDGKDLAGNELNGCTDFFLGAVMNHYVEGRERIHKKIEAGARFFQTQLVFDSTRFLEFIDGLKPMKAKVIAGIMPLRSLKTARFLQKKLPGIDVPDEIVKEMEKAKDQKEKGIEIARKTIGELREETDGIHIMPLSSEEVALRLVKR